MTFETEHCIVFTEKGVSQTGRGVRAGACPNFQMQIQPQKAICGGGGGAFPLVQ